GRSMLAAKPAGGDGRGFLARTALELAGLLAPRLLTEWPGWRPPRRSFTGGVFAFLWRVCRWAV
ncbi:hypothetical protein, partial [Thermogutta sp.]|uniref:hypothetical protein n=1 Tax=Thermogutta sp. TaxID=1962930 RepID=UPI003C7DF0A3